MVSIIVALIVCLCSSSVVLGVAAMVANSTVVLRREQARFEIDRMRCAIEHERARTETFHALKDFQANITIESERSKTKSLAPGINTELLVDHIYKAISESNFRRNDSMQ